MLTLLFGYNGLTELFYAHKKALGETIEDGRPYDERAIRKHLWTAHVPMVGLIIRTGCDGDPHLSDSLLPVQTEHAQLYFTKTRWPAFDVAELKCAFDNYSQRPRRLGV